MNDYRSRLRSSPRQGLNDNMLFSGMSPGDLDFGDFPTFANSPSPRKNRNNEALMSPHKSGYFLRTPSPMRKLQNFLSSPRKSPRNEFSGTPSPQKPTSATDLFGNDKSLLDNLDVPEDWDENFLSNFQDDWLIGLGTEDLESLGKSPMKSPGRVLHHQYGTKNASPVVSPFKSPLLTSSPKHSGFSPLLWGKTPPPVNGGRPITRQKKLFAHSPEKQNPPRSSNHSNAVSWNAPLPFSTMHDASSSSALSDGFETTSSLHSISSYLKNFDDEDIPEDMPVMPPVGWTASKAGKVVSRTGKTGGKGSLKVKREKKIATPQLIRPAEHQQSYHHQSFSLPPASLQSTGGKKLKMEPQFTLLRPHTELRTHQISLRTAPVTPPNKVKISRDFSQIQTLPSKEQLRIVRNRFTETLNKAVEQVIQREKSKRTHSSHNAAITASGKMSAVASIQQSSHSAPGPSMPITSGLPYSRLPPTVIAVKPPPSKRRKR